MNDKNFGRKLTAILLVLISIAIIIIAFIGIYVQKLNKLVDVVPDATYSSEIEGTIEYRLSVDLTSEEEEVYVDEEGTVKGHVHNGSDTSDDDWENTTGYTIETQTVKANEDDALTTENYKKTKSIIEDRLDQMGATEYSIRLNEETGDMVVEFSENDNIEYLYETAVDLKGEFDIIDYQTGVVLIDGSHLVSASEYTYSSDGITYDVYLQIQLDEEGAEILKEISNEYIAYTDDDGESQTDYISIRIDGSAIYTTYFGEEYTSSILNIPLGQDLEDDETLESYVESTEAIATVLNSGELPVSYETDDASGYLIQSNINDSVLAILEIVLIICLILITIIFTVKYKFNGFLAGIFNAGFIGSVILILKLLGIVISISSMFAIVVLVLINVLFLIKYLRLLQSAESKSYLEAIKSFYSITFPVIVVAFVFTVFSTNTSITGIGMTLFWGLILEIVFNSIITRYVLNSRYDKK